MKKIFSILALSLTLLTGVVKADNHQVKIQSGEINWLGKKVTGEHKGTIQLKQGSLTKDANGVYTAAEFEADMTTIKNLDIEDPTYNTKFINHMKSDDFFSIEKHTSSQFKSTKVTKISDTEYDITGDLTIKGITKPVSFKAKITPAGDALALSADLKIDRTQYDIRYGSGKFFENLGDKMIYDEFEFKVTAKVAK